MKNKKKGKRNETIQNLYMYIYDLCVFLDINYNKNIKTKKQTVAMPKDIIINDYSKDILYMLVAKTIWTYSF